MSAEHRQTLFHGHTNWYVRATIWFTQALVAGLLLEATFGRLGVLATGFVSALLLFRQFDSHVQQATSD